MAHIKGNESLGLGTLVFLCSVVCVFSSLSDVTDDVFGSRNPGGVVAAFGDLDANKATDIFVLSRNGKSLHSYDSYFDIKRDLVEFTDKELITGKDSDAPISNVVPGDFNTDAQMDMLITRKPDVKSNFVKVEFYDGKDPKGAPYLTLNETLKDQPIVVDANGDLILDLFGETKDGTRAFWIFGRQGTYTFEPITNGSDYNLPQLRFPQSSAFLDLDGDLTADLCAVSNAEDGRINFEFWLNTKGVLKWDKTILSPPQLKVIGQASFADLNGNQAPNIILPGCLDDACEKSAIFVWQENKYSKGGQGKWYQLKVNFQATKSRTTTFPKSLDISNTVGLPPHLRLGDFNLDGYPDAVAILSDTQQGKTNYSAFVLYNSGCKDCGGFSRTLTIDYSRTLQKANPIVVTFFDLKENGVLDLILTERNEDGSLVVRAIEQDFTGDASFLKVVVVGGVCYDNCPNGNSPYGVNQVGPVAKFESTTPMGDVQVGVASQLSQSAYFSLQLPFVLFGLGQTPNFVDELEVGVPYPDGQSPRRHSWATIIPNSQVIVIPYPASEPYNWRHELYVTPSRLVLLTGASLLGTCAFIAIIVGLLHWRERIEDKKEKLQESQRFHFDAM